MSDDSSTRINKYIAARLKVARREADNLVGAGRVRINDQPAAMGSRVTAADSVSVDGKPLTETTPDRVIIALNKPVGYVCSHRAQSAHARTIYELLPPEFSSLNSVGRLDRDSSGLILLTNDGEFSHRMTHPSFHKVKIYEVTLDHPLEPLHHQMINDYGVTLEDGVSQFLVEKLDLRENYRGTPSKNQGLPSKNSHRYKVTMSEGRNRQIRRTFAALGYTVTSLHRTQFGSYSLGDISPGQWHQLDIS